MNEAPFQDLWNNFWLYFENNWIKRYKPSDWNIHAILALEKETADDILINRTNSVLNGLLKANPTLTKFVVAIEVESTRFVDQYNYLKREKTKKSPCTT